MWAGFTKSTKKQKLTVNIKVFTESVASGTVTVENDEDSLAQSKRRKPWMCSRWVKLGCNVPIQRRQVIASVRFESRTQKKVQNELDTLNLQCTE